MKSTLIPGLPYSRRPIGFCTLAGVENARLKGKAVVGRWKEPLTFVYGPTKGSLAEEFANWPSDPAAMLKFTKKYGPLECKAVPGQEFRQPLDHWRDTQKAFRFYWEGLAQHKRGGSDSWVYVAKRGEQFSFLEGRFIFVTNMLWGLLLLDLHACPRERLRKCGRPDCPHLYFVAHHLGQNYCSDLCAAWAQKQWRLKWWAEHGEEWRKKRRESKSRKRR